MDIRYCGKESREREREREKQRERGRVCVCVCEIDRKRERERWKAIEIGYTYREEMDRLYRVGSGRVGFRLNQRIYNGREYMSRLSA